MSAIAVLPAGERDRLVKLLGMLGSDHPGERDNAAIAAHRLVQRRGLTWFEIVELQQASVAEETWKPTWTPPPPLVPWRETVLRCMRYSMSLTDWERHFLGGLSQYQSLSPKQAACLCKISDRLFGADHRRWGIPC